MRYLLDASVVVKRYAPERGSRWIKGLIGNHENSVTIVKICIVEVAAALAKKVRTGEISRDDCQQALNRFLADIERGDYDVLEIDDEVVSFAVNFNPASSFAWLRRGTSGCCSRSLPRPGRTWAFIYHLRRCR